MICVVVSRVEIECPFCGKTGVKALFKPSYLEHKTSRISEGAKTQYYRVPDSYEVMGGCPHCGKSEEDVKRAFETGMTREVTHQERLERLRKAGLPTRIVGTREA